MSKRLNGKQLGFTLLETALVLVIGGILLSMLGGSLLNTMTTAKIKATKTRINEINTALNNYVKINGQFPCVASLEEPVNTANYGREISAVSAKTCAKAPTDGTKRVNGTDNRKVRIGMVPTRALNLPDKFGYDAWGSRFMYAVTEVMTDAATYDSSLGAISIIDSNGNSAVSPQGSVTHLIYSTGKDRKGGYNTNGVQSPCGSKGLDIENCNDDSIFRNTIVTSDVKDTYFDDFLAYSAPEVKAPSPTGAIVNVQMFRGYPSSLSAGNYSNGALVGVTTKTKTFRATYKRSPGVTSALVIAVAPGAVAPSPAWLKGGYLDTVKNLGPGYSGAYNGQIGSTAMGIMVNGETRWAVISPDEEEDIEIGPPAMGDFDKMSTTGFLGESSGMAPDLGAKDSEGWYSRKSHVQNVKTYCRDRAGDAKFGNKVIARGAYSIAPNQINSVTPKNGDGDAGAWHRIPQAQSQMTGKGGTVMSGPRQIEPDTKFYQNSNVIGEYTLGNLPQSGGDFSYGFGGVNGGMIMVYEYR